ncbi:hypothetical protein NPIL_420721 [Nephila pilipes]|uniref:Reverse transcriptase/retrotransposon-derived protein RNase H-like domain-containing protein n=1 Tax=Nephila pilipes TaxID=299642 RepID=A0A8X6QGH9_NEPPI|nr:hypothetical protein NPIL_420721 [Nephila pilipes]
MNDLSPADQRDVSVADQLAGTPLIRNIVDITGVSNNVLRSAQNHVPLRRKTRAAVTRLIGWRHKKDSNTAFERCKKDLAQVAFLYHPAEDALLDIVVYASDTAVGAALHQKVPKEWQPQTFF